MEGNELVPHLCGLPVEIDDSCVKIVMPMIVLNAIERTFDRLREMERREAEALISAMDRVLAR